MIKKQVALVLVLGMASTAGAAIVELQLDGGGTMVTAGSTVTINIVADASVWPYFRVGALTVSGGTVPAVGTLHTRLTEGIDISHGTLKDGTIENIVIFQINGAIRLISSIPILSGEVLYSFDVVAGTAGTTLAIDDWTGINPFPEPPYHIQTNISTKGGETTDIAGLSLSVVPEPGTVLLLGLGGIALRRKRH